MDKLEFSVVIFVDNKGHIAVQKRGNKSRNNEEFAFWGGRAKKDESGLETIERELAEELGYIPNDLEFVSDYEFEIKEGKFAGMKIVYHTFLAQITKKLLQTKVMEGDGVVKIKVSDVKNNNFFQGDKDLIKELLKENRLKIDK